MIILFKMSFVKPYIEEVGKLQFFSIDSEVLFPYILRLEKSVPFV